MGNDKAGRIGVFIFRHVGQRYVIALPVCKDGYLRSLQIAPTLSGSDTGTVVSFSPLVFFGGTVFTLLAVHLGASVSAGKAERVSPIEAIRRSGGSSVNFKPRSSANRVINKKTFNQGF